MWLVTADNNRILKSIMIVIAGERFLFDKSFEMKQRFYYSQTFRYVPRKTYGQVQMQLFYLNMRKSEKIFKISNFENDANNDRIFDCDSCVQSNSSSSFPL